MHQLPTFRAPDVQEDISTFLDASYAPSTKEKYRQEIMALLFWLSGRPLTDQTFAEYLAHLYNSGKAPSTCSISISAVKTAARLANTSHPVGPLTERTMAGIRRKGRSRGRGQVMGLKWEDVEKIITVAARNGEIRDIRNIAIVSTMSDALLRISELIALRVEDIGIEQDGSGRIHIRHSKTDQEGEGATLYLGECTMARLSQWIEWAEIKEGALFRPLMRGGRVRGHALSRGAAQRLISDLIQRAGFKGRYSSHSFRVGAAQSLVERGASIPEIQLAGRWQEPRMVAHYARGQLAGQGVVARLRYGSGPRQRHVERGSR